MFTIVLLALHLNAPGTVADDRDEVRAVLERFEAAWNDGDVATMVMAYTDPHVDVNHPSPVLTREETRSMLESLEPGRRYRIRITSDEVVIEGDRAFQRGTFVLTPIAEAAASGRAEVTKRYLEILRRTEDGRWAVWWSMDGPVSP